MKKERQQEFFVIAHNIRSLFNVGSIFRTADAFGMTKLFLTGYTGTPPESKIAKVALGAELSVPWEHNASAARVITKLRKEYPDITIIGLENNLPASVLGTANVVGSPPLLQVRRPVRHSFSDGGSFSVGGTGGARGGCVPLHKFRPRFPLALILGEEVGGIPKPLLKRCDAFMEIPMLGTKESLNVSVAFGVAAYAIRNQT